MVVIQRVELSKPQGESTLSEEEKASLLVTDMRRTAVMKEYKKKRSHDDK
jgi:hypothetical protein